MKIRLCALIMALMLLCGAGCELWKESPPGVTPPDQTETEPPIDEPPVPPVQEPETVSQNELLETMKQTVYQDNITASGIGLSSPKSVGVDREKFEEEVRYPVPEEGEFARVINASEYGISSRSKDNTGAVESLIASLQKETGATLVRLPKGKIRFSRTTVFRNLKNVWLVGNQTEWIMTEWKPLMQVLNCEDFHLNEIDFDYEPASTVSGKVCAVNASQKQIIVQLEDEFDCSDSRFKGGKIAYGNYMEYVWKDGYNCYIPDENGLLTYNSTGDGYRGITDGSYDSATNRLTLTFSNFKAPQIGKVVSVSFTMYEYHGVFAEDCRNFYMESCNIYAAEGMAILLYNLENIYLNRTNVCLRNGTKRLQTATADGIHTNGCYGEMIVSNSLFENSHDDAINVCTFYNYVQSATNRMLICSAYSTVTNYPIVKGDMIEIYDNKTMESIGTYKVTAAENSGMTYTVTVDSRLRNVQKGYLIGNLTRTTALTVENCIFRNKRNRGILLQSHDSVVKNCTFSNVIHGAIMLHAALDIFSEAIIPRNCRVENCKFLDNNAGQGCHADVAVFRSGGTVLPNTIRTIEITNNFFYRSATRSIYACGTGENVYTNNLFYDICVKSAGESATTGILFDYDSGSIAKGNHTFFTGKKPDLYQCVRIERSENTLDQSNKVTVI